MAGSMGYSTTCGLSLIHQAISRKMCSLALASALRSSLQCIPSVFIVLAPERAWTNETFATFEVFKASFSILYSIWTLFAHSQWMCKCFGILRGLFILKACIVPSRRLFSVFVFRVLS